MLERRREGGLKKDATTYASLAESARATRQLS